MVPRRIARDALLYRVVRTADRVPPLRENSRRKGDVMPCHSSGMYACTYAAENRSPPMLAIMIVAPSSTKGYGASAIHIRRPASVVVRKKGGIALMGWKIARAARSPVAAT